MRWCVGDVGDEVAERIDVGVGGATSIGANGMARGAVIDFARVWWRCSGALSKLLVLRLRLPGPRCRSWTDDGAKVAESE